MSELIDSTDLSKGLNANTVLELASLSKSSEDRFKDTPFTFHLQHASEHLRLIHEVGDETTDTKSNSSEAIRITPLEDKGPNERLLSTITATDKERPNIEFEGNGKGVSDGTVEQDTDNSNDGRIVPEIQFDAAPDELIQTPIDRADLVSPAYPNTFGTTLIPMSDGTTGDGSSHNARNFVESLNSNDSMEALSIGRLTLTSALSEQRIPDQTSPTAVVPLSSGVVEGNPKFKEPVNKIALQIESSSINVKNMPEHQPSRDQNSEIDNDLMLKNLTGAEISADKSRIKASTIMSPGAVIDIDESQRLMMQHFNTVHLSGNLKLTTDGRNASTSAMAEYGPVGISHPGMRQEVPVATNPGIQVLSTQIELNSENPGNDLYLLSERYDGNGDKTSSTSILTSLTQADNRNRSSTATAIQVDDITSGDLVASSLTNMFHATSSGILTAPNPSRIEAGSGLTLAPFVVPMNSGVTDHSLQGNVRWMVSEGITNATINVSPSGMGPISVQVLMEGEQMSVSIMAGQAATREALDLVAPRLRDQFVAQGYDLVKIEVSDNGSGTSTSSNSGTSDRNNSPTRQDLGETKMFREENVLDERNEGESLPETQSDSLIDDYV